MPLIVEFTLFALSIIGLTAFLAIIMHAFGTNFSKQSKSFSHHLNKSKSSWRGIQRDNH
ncbi:hypothetical protein [Alkalihalobacillus sp. CinArs1]|uniref:hypothetical protein n=1 Tax=Alkalihalobacillus sp. CinArs1 TaxID=2995314 RepID=UPI0022DE2981|nr:hypothetical protein [Alkalihalobacillus sp. CinArs1]